MLISLPNTEATESIIKNNNIENEQYNLISDSDNNLYACYIDSNDLYFAKSTNEGESWTNTQLLTADSHELCDIAVDSHDNLYIFYATTDSDIFKIYKSTDGGTTWNNLTTVHTSDQPLNLDIFVDSDDDLHLAYCVEDQPAPPRYDVLYRKWSYELETLSSETIVKNDDTVECDDISVVEMSNGDVFLIWLRNTASVVYDSYDLSSDSWIGQQTLLSDADYSNFDKPKAIITPNDRLHVVAQGENAATGNEEIVYSVDFSSSVLKLSESDGYSQYSPDISYNSNGNLNVVWHGKSVDSGNYQLKQITYDNSWQDVGIITTGSDNKINPRLLYERYPSFTWLQNDIATIFENSTDNNFYYVDSDSLSWYTSGEPSGEYDIVPSCTSGYTLRGKYYNALYRINNNNYVKNTPKPISNYVNDNEAHQYLLYNYFIPTTCNIGNVYLTVHSSVIDSFNDNSEYTVRLKINNNYIGNYDNYYQLESDKYVLVWENTDISIENENIGFIFDYYGNTAFEYYVSDSDIISDSIEALIVGNNDASHLWNNWENEEFWTSDNWMLLLFFNMFTDSRMVVENYDPCISFCQQVQTSEELKDFSNNIVMPVTEGCTNKTYTISTFLNQTSMLQSSTNRRLIVEKNNLVYMNETLLYQDSTYGFTPSEIGIYYVNLTVNGVIVDSETLTIDCELTDFCNTYPNPSFIGQEVTFTYQNTNTERQCVIWITEDYIFDIFNSVDFFQPVWIDSDTSGSFTFSFPRGGKFIIMMAYYINETGNYQTVMGNPIAHYVKSVFDNHIEVINQDNIVKTHIGQKLFYNGWHSHIGTDVYVMIDNHIIQNVGDVNYFSNSLSYDKSGYHELKLVMYDTDGTLLTLDNDTFFVTSKKSEGVKDDGDATDFFGIGNIDDGLKVFIGAFITLGFLFLPIGLVASLKRINFKVDIPNITYAVSCGIGMVLAVGLGFWGYEFLFFVSVMAALVIVLTWIKGRGASE